MFSDPACDIQPFFFLQEQGKMFCLNHVTMTFLNKKKTVLFITVEFEPGFY